MPEPEGYREKVFAFSNNYMTRARWDVSGSSATAVSHKVTDDEHADGKLSTGNGICAAMSSMWIAKSIQIGKAAAAKDLDDNIHRIALAQGAYLQAAQSWRKRRGDSGLV